MLAVERLEKALNDASVAASRTKSSGAVELIAAAVKRDGRDGVIELLNLMSDAIDEVTSCEFRREARKEQFISQILAMRDMFFSALLSGSQRELESWLRTAARQFQLISLAVTERIEVDTAPLDRANFISKTSELIEEVKQWPIEDYAKRALVLSLSMISQQASVEGSSFTDHELRRRVKTIVASFALEFSVMDKEFETRWEMIKRWAAFGFRGSAVPLGLTADASQIAGLLPKP